MTDCLNQRLEALNKDSRVVLLNKWRVAFASDPPRYVSVELMRHALGYALQAEELGGLSNSSRRELVAIGRGRGAGVGTPARYKAGTKLLRQWQGTTHEVLVTDRGFAFDGKTYSSLSAVAFAITGAKWSGPRFFRTVKAKARSNV